MKFLADMGISMATVRALREAGYEVIHLLEEGLCGLPDPEILEKARMEGRVLLTCDLDFGDLLAASGDSLPSVILFRLSDYTPAFLNPRLMEVLATRRDDLEQGAIVIVQDNRFRVRRLPISR